MAIRNSQVSTQDIGRMADLAYATANGSRDWGAVSGKLAEAFGVDASLIVHRNLWGTQDSYSSSLASFETCFTGQSGETSTPRQGIDEEGGSMPEDVRGSPCRRLLKDHHLYQSWLRPIGVESLATVHTEYRPNHNASCRFSVIRDGQRIKFGQLEKDVLRALLPHLQQAFALAALRATVETMQTRWDCLVESLQTGVLLLDPMGFVVEKNAVAATILERCDGIHCLGKRLYLRQGCALVDAGTRIFREQTVVPSSFIVRRPAGGGAYQVTCKTTVDHMRPAHHLSHPVALLMIDQRDIDPASNLDHLASTHHITPQEQVVLRMLVDEELSPKLIADKLNVSVRTVRTQLSSIYGKTGTSGQKELLRLILGGKV